MRAVGVNENSSNELAKWVGFYHTAKMANSRGVEKVDEKFCDVIVVVAVLVFACGDCSTREVPTGYELL